MTNQLFDVRCRHTDHYYLSVIEGLLSGLKAGLKDRDVATHLNDLGLLSATGAAWTQPAVAMALFKLRHSRDKSSHLHNAMLQLSFDGLLTKAQVLPLLQPRNQPAVRM